MPSYIGSPGPCELVSGGGWPSPASENGGVADREFYREQATAVEEDVFLSISPSWMSSFEQSLLWISGYMPSILFPIIDGGVADELTPRQRQWIEEVKAEARRKEKEITQVMAMVQETVAEQPVYGVMRKFGKMVNCEVVAEMHAALEELQAAMKAMVGNADALHGWTVAEVVEVLDPLFCTCNIITVG